jgi:DNA-directed RNA polymerase subunit N (RpoN/RPB10)
VPIASAPATDAPGSLDTPRSSVEWMAAARAAGLDPTPTPITLRGLPDLALRTLRTEITGRRALGRRLEPRPGRILASVMPGLERPVFLVGAARSGTTFLGEVLGSLPEISYHHEPVATKAAARYVHDGLWSERRGRRFYRMVYRWLMRVEIDGGRRFAEKTPWNAFLLPFLARTFPGLQVIHIVRDGRDVAASHIRKPWLRADSATSGKREPGGYLYGPWAQWWVPGAERAAFEAGPDVLRMSMAWRLFTDAALRDGPALGADHYLELRYESLVTDPSAVGERVLDFLGIERPASRRALISAVGRADRGSVGGWRTTLDDEAVRVLMDDSGELLGRLGYR